MYLQEEPVSIKDISEIAKKSSACYRHRAMLYALNLSKHAYKEYQGMLPETKRTELGRRVESKKRAER